MVMWALGHSFSGTICIHRALEWLTKSYNLHFIVIQSFTILTIDMEISNYTNNFLTVILCYGIFSICFHIILHPSSSRRSICLNELSKERFLFSACNSPGRDYIIELVTVTPAFGLNKSKKLSRLQRRHMLFFIQTLPRIFCRRYKPREFFFFFFFFGFVWTDSWGN